MDWRTYCVKPVKMENANSVEKIINVLKLEANSTYLKNMENFKVTSNISLGISIPILRKYAKPLKYNHELALELWKTKIREARILAVYIDNPKEVTEKQMNQWVNDFDTWDICDQCCGNLFDRTNFAFNKAIEWCQHKKEFVKRAGFVMMAYLAIHDKKAGNFKFEQFFPFISKEAYDQRNFAKKGVNWALRQIGKRNIDLNKKAIDVAQKIHKQKTNSAKWIASDALRELQSEKVNTRLIKMNVPAYNKV